MQLAKEEEEIVTKRMNKKRHEGYQFSRRTFDFICFDCVKLTSLKDELRILFLLEIVGTCTGATLISGLPKLSQVQLVGKSIPLPCCHGIFDSGTMITQLGCMWFSVHYM